MYTQCPHCETLFRISSEQLRSAGGKARCCQCNQVFNALAGLREDVSDEKHDEDEGENQDEANLFSNTLNLDESQLYEASEESLLEVDPEEPMESLFWEQDDGLNTEPAYMAMGSESQMSDLLSQDSASSNDLADEPDQDADIIQISDHIPAENSALGDEDESLPEESPEPANAAAVEAIEPENAQESRGTDSRQDYELDEMFDHGPSPWVNLLWGIGGLLMFAILGLQIAWYYRERVVQIPYGEAFFQTLCQYAECQPPRRRDLSQIQIEHRDLRAHPEQQGALLLQLGLINRADYDQPYPRLQLSLYNDRQKLIAQRIFEPGEYLSDGREAGLMLSRRTVNINMELLDPGRDVTGFKFEFL